MEENNFSVLMSTYINDNPQHLDEAINSILHQTKLPSEIVLVLDGPIKSTCTEIIDGYDKKKPGLFKIIPLQSNKGLGHALSIGMQSCTYDLVARMDSDDICVSTRFEKQVDFLNERLDIAVVGCNVEEFDKVPGDTNRFRIMPKDGEELVNYSKFRSPVNHPSIMLRKAAVIDSGNYNGNIKLFEDYSLFIRIMHKGYMFYNLQDVLLHFRVGDGLQTIKRRSGWHYIKSEISFLKYAYQLGHINAFELIKSILIKLPIRLLPATIVLRLYNFFLRTR